MRQAIAILVLLTGLCPSIGWCLTAVEEIDLSFRTDLAPDLHAAHVGDIVVVRAADASAALRVGQGPLDFEPRPGTSEVVSREDIVSLIHRLDPNLSPRIRWVGALQQVSVHKPGHWLTTQEITTGTTDALSRWLADRVKNFEVHPSTHRSEDRWVEPDSVVQYRVADPASIRQRMPVWVDIQAPDGQSRSFPFWFNVSAYSDVWVASRDILAGDPVKASDVALQQVDVAKLNSDFVPVSEAFVDRIAVFPLKLGDVLLSSRIMKRPDVVAGDSVAVHLVRARVQLETTALALQTADKGSRILIRNVRSGENIVARVSDKDAVEVGP